MRQRTIPLPLQTLEAATVRISIHHRDRRKLEKDLDSRRKGYNGELTVDRLIHKFFHRKFTILHDVTLTINGFTFQADTILIARHGIFILEIKTHSGTITFDTVMRQLIRSDGKKENGSKYPITQVENTQHHLSNWLEKHHFYDVPIYRFVVISDPSTVLKVIGDADELAKVVVHAADLPQRIMKMNRWMGEKDFPQLPHIKIGKTILGECKEFNIDFRKEYSFRDADFMTGVCCPTCGTLGMKRVHSNWLCLKCGCKSKRAHLQALNEYFLLMKQRITNEECMQWLHISSRHTVSRLLKSSGLRYDPARRCWHK